MMPDAEIIKLIINGGMFGLWLIVVYWLLFHGVPLLKTTIEKMLVTFKEELATERGQCERNAIEQRELHQQTRHQLRSLITAADLKKYMDAQTNNTT
jgi:hypothetical protein